MTPEQFGYIPPRLLQLPVVASVVANGQALLLDALKGAGFKWMRTVPGEVRLVPGPVAFQGGFNVRDPSTGSELSVAAALVTVESPSGFGFCHYWEVTPVLWRKAQRRAGGLHRLAVRQIQTHLLAPETLALYDEEKVLGHFAKVVGSLPFAATNLQASDFAARLSDALAP